MLSGIVVAALCIPALLTAVWLIQVLAGSVAMLRERSPGSRAPDTPSFKTAVLIPAHNEGKGTLPTIRDLQAQIRSGDRILLVADNCSDDTADVARAAGAEVIVRNDPARRGKGYALQYGVEHLVNDPPDIVVIMDADCRLADGALQQMSAVAMAGGRPAQALYLMYAPENAPQSKAVNVFAWRVRNWLRPLGMRALGLPTLLFGTGMAFPFAQIRGRDLGNSRLAEDTALGLTLAADGHAPIFVPAARIHSHFPSTEAASERQRQRWEKGQFDNIVDLVPGAIATAVRKRNVHVAALALDMLVPPLTLLVLMTAACIVIGAVAALLGASSAALVVPMLSATLLVVGVLIAWGAVGRQVLPLKDLLGLPLHVLRKIGFYRGIASGKATSTWIRTDRQ